MFELCKNLKDNFIRFNEWSVILPSTNIQRYVVANLYESSGKGYWCVNDHETKAELNKYIMKTFRSSCAGVSSPEVSQAGRKMLLPEGPFSAHPHRQRVSTSQAQYCDGVQKIVQAENHMPNSTSRFDGVLLCGLNRSVKTKCPWVRYSYREWVTSVR